MRVIVQGGPGAAGRPILGVLMSAALIVGAVVAIIGGALIVLLVVLPLGAIALLGFWVKGLTGRVRAVVTGGDGHGRRNVRVIDPPGDAGAP